MSVNYIIYFIKPFRNSSLSVAWTDRTLSARSKAEAIVGKLVSRWHHHTDNWHFRSKNKQWQHCGQHPKIFHRNLLCVFCVFCGCNSLRELSWWLIASGLKNLARLHLNATVSFSCTINCVKMLSIVRGGKYLVLILYYNATMTCCFFGDFQILISDIL